MQHRYDTRLRRGLREAPDQGGGHDEIHFRIMRGMPAQQPRNPVRLHTDCDRAVIVPSIRADFVPESLRAGGALATRSAGTPSEQRNFADFRIVAVLGILGCALGDYLPAGSR